MLPVDYVCNEAFLPLEGAVSPSRGKQSTIFDQTVKVSCSVKFYIQACNKVFILCSVDIFAKPYFTKQIHFKHGFAIQKKALALQRKFDSCYYLSF